MDLRKAQVSDHISKMREEIEAIDQLQRVDIGLLISTPDFQKRKQYLEWFYMKKFQ